MKDTPSFGSYVHGAWEFEFMADKLEPPFNPLSFVTDGGTLTFEATARIYLQLEMK